MSIFDRIFEYSKEVIGLTEEVQKLVHEVEKMDSAQREIDRRVVRVETIIDLAMERSGHRALS